MPAIPHTPPDVGSMERIADAIAVVESNRNPYAHREGSQFYGMYQMGAAAASDVGLIDQRVLHGNEPLSHWAFLKYVKRYEARHRYIPDMIAVLWKGGPGTAKRVLAMVDSGAHIDTAIGVEDKKIPNLAEYVRRFRNAYGSGYGGDVANAGAGSGGAGAGGFSFA